MQKHNRLPSVLIVDDDQRTIDSIRLTLDDGYEICQAIDGEKALETVLKKNIDLMFLDINMPGQWNGLDVLKRIQDSDEKLAVVMVTATDTAKMAVQAMKLGAFDYITKPFDPEEISIVAKKALENRDLLREVVYLRSEVQPTRFKNIIGKSREMEEVYQLISKVSETDATVLISGESGTGKELIARAIHCNSSRRERPLVTINCTGIPESLVETELFGHEKGAFTGAISQKPGKFELAQGGTVFLDEISDLPMDMQGKLLRALQEREIERVGGTRVIPLDVRIIAASNKNLKELVQKNVFREDLYYRLNVVPLSLPPLRNRRDDIPLLVQHFVRVYSERFRKKMIGLSEDALTYLEEYDWPGNVRELENIVERMVVLANDKVLETYHLPLDLFFMKSKKSMMPDLLDKGIYLKDARDQFEREYILAVLKSSGWNQTDTAKHLGIHRNTLSMKREQLGIKISEEKA